MLDWVLSKIGILVFILVAVGALFLFSSSQLAILSQAAKVQSANGISRMIDSLCNNCSINYTFENMYLIDLKEKNITVGGVQRSFLSTATPSSFTADKVRLYKKMGVIYVEKI